MHKITFSKQIDKCLRRMPQNMALKIARKIKLLASDPLGMSNVKKLSNHPGYRLRIGDWRIVYIIYDEESSIHIIKVKTRGEAYK